MDDLGTILTLLLVVLPMAAGLIEKLLKAAGKTGAAGKMKDLAEMFDSKDSSEDGGQAAGGRSACPCHGALRSACPCHDALTSGRAETATSDAAGKTDCGKTSS